MRRLLCILSASALLACASWPGVAQGAFGFKPGSLDVTFTAADESPSMQAGSHPFAFTTRFEVNTKPFGVDRLIPDDEFKDLINDLPPGLVAFDSPVPRCSSADFLPSLDDAQGDCPDSSAVGVADIAISNGPAPAAGGDFLERSGLETVAVYLLVPPPGAVLKLGFIVAGVPVTIEGRLNTSPPYNGQAYANNISQSVLFYGARFTLWADPADPAHDSERGNCAGSPGSCPADLDQVSFLTLPRSCTGPLQTRFSARSWQDQASWISETADTHDNAIPPNPLGLHGCSKLRFAPRLDAKTTNESADGPTGLDVNLDVEDEGISNPAGSAQSDIKKAVVRLPRGVTANPSVAEGLGTCSPGAYAQETLHPAPGDGCPASSKIGTVEIETPLLRARLLKGELFIAQQDDPTTTAPGAENPFDSLLAFYIVIRDTDLGVIVKQAAKIEPDPATGQLVTTTEGMPQLPIGHVRFHLREGGRSPLVTPPSCDADPTTPARDPYTTVAEFTPWADPSSTYTTTSTFEVTKGVAGGPCPPAAGQPFEPGFSAGTLDNRARTFSPFDLRLTRRDGDQDLTKLSNTLPPGLLGKLAGVSRCAEAQIALAKAKTGRQELASPSCPPGSRLGRTSSGAGVGSQLTYVPGSLYLAGPYHGAPFSVVAIVPAVAGPFDIGTVVVRFALRIDPRTAVAMVDGAASDPIPHILAGIPLRVRDLRASVDRPEFTFNPTDCDLFEVGAQIWGGGNDPFSVADDLAVTRSVSFRAADCAALGFKPGLSLSLKGGTKRGGFPTLRFVYAPRSEDANLNDLALRFPRSEFIEQGHFRTICTRVQFAAAGGNGAGCPAAAIYGQARVFTPLLDEPVEGPIFLRSSSHNLPDVVLALHGPPSAPVDFEVPTRIDSIRGGLRATAEETPDVPVSKVVIQMQGGQKGLFVNSTDICRREHRARTSMHAHNGRSLVLKPPLRVPGCPKHRSSSHSRHRAH